MGVIENRIDINKLSKIPTQIEEVKKEVYDNINDSGWLTLSEEYNVKYRRKNGYCTVSMSNLEAMTSTLVGTLPEGFRPSPDIVISVPNSKGNGSLLIGSTGTLLYMLTEACNDNQVTGVFPLDETEGE